jgi:hypothetical protein
MNGCRWGLVALAFALLASGCVMPTTPPVVTPPIVVPASRRIGVTVRGADGVPLPLATGTLTGFDTPATIVQATNPAVPTDAGAIGGRLIFTLAGNFLPLDATATESIAAPGYQSIAWALTLDGDQADLVLQLTPPPVPDPPTRAQALLMQLTFQGLTCHTGQFGDLHWFEPAISWLTPADRQAIYACKKAAGDTHLVLGLPAGWPLYNETGNDFSPDRFPALDWTAGETQADGRLADLIVEVRQAGLIPVFFSDETNEAASLKLVTLAIDALQHSRYGDLTDQVGAFIPGWDGVFYGWPDPHAIPLWATQVRAICPDCRLGIEFNPGHIPLGSGPQDYTVAGGNNGSMAGYDLILGEVDGWITNGTTPGGGVWQILKRVLGPAYVDDPGTDPGDAPWPFYLAPGTPRGPYQFCVFEYDEYSWVRGRTTAAAIAAERAYLRAKASSAAAPRAATASTATCRLSRSPQSGRSDRLSR